MYDPIPSAGGSWELDVRAARGGSSPARVAAAQHPLMCLTCGAPVLVLVLVAVAEPSERAAAAELAAARY